MTIGIAEAKRRGKMSWACIVRNQFHHMRCSGYYVVKVGEMGRELAFCQCECHNTRTEAIAP